MCLSMPIGDHGDSVSEKPSTHPSTHASTSTLSEVSSSSEENMRCRCGVIPEFPTIQEGVQAGVGGGVRGGLGSRSPMAKSTGGGTPRGSRPVLHAPSEDSLHNEKLQCERLLADFDRSLETTRRTVYYTERLEVEVSSTTNLAALTFVAHFRMWVETALQLSTVPLHLQERSAPAAADRSDNTRCAARPVSVHSTLLSYLPSSLCTNTLLQQAHGVDRGAACFRFRQHLRSPPTVRQGGCESPGCRCQDRTFRHDIRGAVLLPVFFQRPVGGARGAPRPRLGSRPSLRSCIPLHAAREVRAVRATPV